MSIDWDALVGRPLVGVFGVPVLYQPAAGSPIAAGGAFQIDGVFDKAYTPVDTGADPSAISTRPVLGVQLSQFPVGFDPERAQGDRFTIIATGLTYIVKAGKPDSHGAARLEANAT